jgi:hypothetical protein
MSRTINYKSELSVTFPSLKWGSRRVWPVSRGCLLLLGTWSYLRNCRRSVLPYTRFCNCLSITITFYTLLTSLFCISVLVTLIKERCLMRNDPSFTHEPAKSNLCATSEKQKPKPNLSVKKTFVLNTDQKCLDTCPVHLTNHSLNECRHFETNPYMYVGSSSKKFFSDTASPKIITNRAVNWKKPIVNMTLKITLQHYTFNSNQQTMETNVNILIQVQVLMTRREIRKTLVWLLIRNVQQFAE